jgi:hypothetical protein
MAANCRHSLNRFTGFILRAVGEPFAKKCQTRKVAARTTLSESAGYILNGIARKESILERPLLPQNHNGIAITLGVEVRSSCHSIDHGVLIHE